MPYKILEKSGIYGLLTLLLVSSIAVIPTSVNAQEKACVMTDAGKKVCGKLVRDSDENQSGTSSQPIVTLEYPTSAAANIQLLKCSRKANIVSCKFSAIMTETGSGYKDMIFYSASGTNVSQVTDNKGEDYIAEKINIGKSEDRGYLKISPVKDQPISVIVLFKIPPEVNTIKTLSFLTGNSHGNSAARFSNVNISR